MQTVQTINGLQFARMLHAGCANLRSHAQAINNLNVFPIPDGDTGDNMLLTFIGGADAVGAGCENLSDTARRASDGMLLSARGNSGVILSQIFEGLADGLTGAQEADNTLLAKALRESVRHAYSAVMEPTEGTMLTVLRMATDYISAKVYTDPETMLQEFLMEAKRVLEMTPQMLPVLKKAGVVDSGGAGLVYIVEGMLDGGENVAVTQAAPMLDPQVDINLFTEDSILEYGYCTELLLRLQRCKTDIDGFQVSAMTQQLKSLGDSVVAFKTGSIVKIHIHTMTPDRVLAFCQRYGEFLKIKIENMSLQHNNTTLEGIRVSTKPQSQRKAIGVVAVASGNGIRELFLERGADVIVDGGQSMNPSAEAFLEAFEQANADTIFVLPNNSNILLTAKQAAGLYPDSDVRVIESRSIGDGYAALSMLSPDALDVEAIQQELTDAMAGVVTLGVSQSVRDSDGVQVGQYIVFEGKNILAARESRLEALCAGAESFPDRAFFLGILIRGKAVSDEESKQAEAWFRTKWPDWELYVIDGQQDIYDYILILE